MKVEHNRLYRFANLYHLPITVAIISGVSVFVNKFAVGAIGNPLLFTGTKNFGVAVLLLVFLVATGKLSKLGKLSRRQWAYMVSVGLVGGTIPFYLFFTGLSQVSATGAALIQKTLVFWVALLAAPLLKEKLTPKQLIGITVLFAGNFLIGGFKVFAFSTGEFMILVATFLWAAETILVKKVVSKIDSDLLATARMGFGSIVLLIVAATSTPQALPEILKLTPTQWAWIAVTGVTLFAYVTGWYKSLKYFPAVTVTAILVSATLITNLLSAIFITHTISIGFVLQGLLIVGGLLMLKAFSLKAENVVDAHKHSMRSTP